jgi:esterase/lipase superfamily enzyme
MRDQPTSLLDCRLAATLALRVRLGMQYCLALLLACSLSACGTADGIRTTAVAEARPLELFYATTRAPLPDPSMVFGKDRGELSYGIAEVAIPPNHIIGRNEQPSVFRFEWSADERKHIAMRGTRPLENDEFVAQLNLAIKQSRNRQLMVFVHGFNTDFAQAVRGLAQFATDLKFEGPVLLFSWPSQSSIMGYATDSTNVEWSQTHLTTVLKDVVDRTDAEQIFVFAHSMGSRALTRAHLNLAAERMLDIYKVEQMILIAPDIDADLFRQDIAPKLARTFTPVTLYASSSDRALAASKTFNGHPRAGDSGRGLVITPGVETVDVSDASSGFLGHTYFSEDRRIMEDIYAILSSGQRSDQRFGLQGVDVPEGRYWTFRR